MEINIFLNVFDLNISAASPCIFLLFYPFTDPITIPFTKYLCKNG